MFSYFALDWLIHPGDLTLYPHSTVHLGLGIWRLLPMGWLPFELALVGLYCAYYRTRTRQLRRFGGRRPRPAR